MTEKVYTIDELRALEEYPGTAYEQKYHFSRFSGKVIKHRDYHRNHLSSQVLRTGIELFAEFHDVHALRTQSGAYRR